MTVEKTPEEITETLRRAGIDIAEFGLTTEDVKRRMEAVRLAAKREVQKTVGLIALERFVDNMGRYMESSEVDTDAWNEAVDNWSADLNDTGREGMKLLVRLALAVREWDKATRGLGTMFETGAPAALRRAVAELTEWERSL